MKKLHPRHGVLLPFLVSAFLLFHGPAACGQLASDVITSVVQRIAVEMTNRVCPPWETMVSEGADACTNILDYAVSNTIPGSLRVVMESAALNCKWTKCVFPGPYWWSAGTSGRVAYLVVDASGLLDANRVGGAPRVAGTNVNEIDISGLPDIVDTNLFLADRSAHGDYETIGELATENPGVTNPVQNVFTRSCSLDRDCFLRDPSNVPTYLCRALTPSAVPGLGTSACELTNKFNINSITSSTGYYRPWDYDGYRNDPWFTSSYKPQLLTILEESGTTGGDPPSYILWNIVNYLDPDRIPHGEADYAYRLTAGGEPIPLINEIVWRKAADYVQTTNYEVVVELWYPFMPLSVHPDDKFSLKMGVYKTRQTDYSLCSEWNNIASNTDILSDTYTYTNWTFAVNEMICGTPSEFLCFTGRFAFLSADGSNAVAIASANPAYFYCQVRKEDFNPELGTTIVNPVDDAMGYGDTLSSKRLLFPLGATIIQNNSPWTISSFNNDGQGYSVCDPRINGQVKYWTDAGADWSRNVLGDNYSVSLHTLGTTNSNCRAYACGRSQGIPMCIRNGPMLNIGELGLIFRSNLDDVYAQPDLWYWQTLNLMHRTEGCTLLDLLTVRDPSQQVPVNGLFCINSRNKEAIKALLHNVRIGYTNESRAASYPLLPSDIDAIADQIIAGGPYMSFRTLFTAVGSQPAEAGYLDGGGGPLATAFRKAATNAVQAVEGPGAKVNDICKEEPFRQICEMITFRQNIFCVIAVGQVVGPDPDGAGGQEPPVLAEERATCIITRDAYTGTSSVYSVSYVHSDPHCAAVNGNHRRPFTGWANAATNIADAVNAAGDGDTVLVSNGTYRIPATIVVTNAVTVKGGGRPGAKIVDGRHATQCFCVSNAEAVLDGFTITGGEAISGGGVYLAGGGTVRNCIIAGNSVPSGPRGGTGGGVYCDHGGTVENCTIVSNWAILTGGGVYCDGGGTIRNSIIWSNATSLGSENWDNLGAGMEYSYCCTIPDPGGVANVTNDPAFADSGDGDWNLTEDSPCVNSGWNQEWMVSATDVEGKNRVIAVTVDMGASEFIQPDGDMDRDNLPDWWEWKYAWSLTNIQYSADDDGDCSMNCDEFLCGTDPENRYSLLEMKKPYMEESGEGLVVRWSSVTGKRYRIMRGTNLAEGFSNEVWTNIPAVEPVNIYTDSTAAGGGPYFYRVKLEQ